MTATMQMNQDWVDTPVTVNGVTWSPDVLTVVIEGAVTGVLVWGTSVVVALGGGWIVLGIFLGLSAFGCAIVALQSLFNFEHTT